MSHASVLVALDGPIRDWEIEQAVFYQMEPFNENGEWFRDGSRWDWWVIGGRFDGMLPRSIMRRSEIDLVSISEYNRDMLWDTWQRAQKEDPKVRSVLYGVEANESFDLYLRRHTTVFPACYAFLRHRIWHERERMGWFGGVASTECELAGSDLSKCLHQDEKTGAKVVSWGNDPDWDKKFYNRFVRDLPLETVLVVVDYHV